MDESVIFVSEGPPFKKRVTRSRTSIAVVAIAVEPEPEPEQEPEPTAPKPSKGPRAKKTRGSTTTRSRKRSAVSGASVASSASPLREKAARLRRGIECHYLECAGFAAVLPVMLVVLPAMFKINL